MDRARHEVMERAEILARFPEFACLVHPVVFVSKRQNELLLARLARNALRLSNGCIVWDATCNNDGYGRISLWMPLARHNVNEYVHRVVWLMKSGKDIPPWKEIAHECNTPPCFNPEHVKCQRMLDNRRDSAVNTNRKKARRTGLYSGAQA